MRKAWIYLVIALILPSVALALDSMDVDDAVCFDNTFCYTIKQNSVYFDNSTDTGTTWTLQGLENMTVYDMTNGVILSFNSSNVTLSQPVANISLHFYTEGVTPTLTNCSSGTKIMTFTFYNETTRTDTVDNTTVEVTYYDANYHAANWSFDLTGNYTYDICMYPDYASYNFDMDLTYYSGGYEYRTWFLDNISLSNSTHELDMYHITTAESQGTSIHIQDVNGDDVENALIQVQRYYMDIGQYITTTIGRTDANGDAYIYLVPYDVWYKFIIVKDGTVLADIEAQQIKDTEMTFTVTESGLLELWNYWDKIAYSCSENQATNYFQCSVVDTSGLMHSVCLRVERVEAVTSVLECDLCSPYTTGFTIGCSGINSTENRYYYSLYSVMNDTHMIFSGWLGTNIGDDTYGLDGLLAAVILIGTVSTIGFFNPAAAIVISLVGLGISTFLGFTSMQLGTLISIVVVGLILVFKMRS